MKTRNPYARAQLGFAPTKRFCKKARTKKFSRKRFHPKAPTTNSHRILMQKSLHKTLSTKPRLALEGSRDETPVGPGPNGCKSRYSFRKRVRSHREVDVQVPGKLHCVRSGGYGLHDGEQPLLTLPRLQSSQVLQG